VEVARDNLAARRFKDSSRLPQEFTLCSYVECIIPNEIVMVDQIVIIEKTSQAKDVRAAIGSRYGMVLPAEGHLFDLLEPEDVVPEWKRWSPVLLRPQGLYGTRPAKGGNKAAKLKAIREALSWAKQVWLATDCDREGQLIGQEILEHYNYRGRVMRVLFTAQDAQTIRQSFDRAKPNSEYAGLYAAAVARRQADQIYNLSLTRTATVILGKGTQGVPRVSRQRITGGRIVWNRWAHVVGVGGRILRNTQSSNALPFRQLNEDFCDGIVMAIPASAHAGSKIVFAEERLPLLAGELSALVGMDHHLGLMFAPSNSTQQGLKSEVRCHARLHGPPDDTS